MEVEDDGAGFDVSGLDLGDDTDSAAPSSGNAPDGHIGLKNIRFRVQEITGGTLKIESHPGKGTKVTVSFVKTEVNTENMGGCHPNQQPSHGGWWAYKNTADG